MEKHQDNQFFLPNAELPPLSNGPKRKMLIEIEVAADFEKRLDNQWMVEREIHADRWAWKWADEVWKRPINPFYSTLRALALRRGEEVHDYKATDREDYKDA